MKARLSALGVVLASIALALASGARAADPTKGECLSASESWLKLKQDRKLREARAQLLVCAASSCPNEVREECAKHVGEINAAIPTIVFEVKDAGGNDVSAVRVTMDGKPLVDRLDGSAVPIDPGEHSFGFEVQGLPPTEKKLLVREGEKDRREKIQIGSRAAAPSATPALAPAPAPAPVSGSSPRKTIGLVVGAVGIVGVGVGTVFGLGASSKWQQAKDDCGAGCAPDAPAQQEKSDAQSKATISTIAFAAGGVALAAGAILYFTAPGGDAPKTGVRVVPSVGPGSEGVAVVGRF